jgi:glycerophosphoryl diester phosphodiesterase
MKRAAPLRPPARHRPLVIAHRGDSRSCPENTLAAFASAAAAGADGIELDVRLSADGIPVVCHDATLARFGGGTRRLSRRTLADLGRDSVGAWFSQRYAAQRIPTLAAVLGSFPRQVFIELKAGSGRGAKDGGRRLAAAVVCASTSACSARPWWQPRARAASASTPTAATRRRSSPACGGTRPMRCSPTGRAGWSACSRAGGPAG